MKIRYKLLKLIPLTILLTGCLSSEDSSNVDISDMYADIDLRSEKAGSTRVSVALREAKLFGSNIVLSKNEQLIASSDGLTKTLKKNSNLLDIEYRTTLGTSNPNAPFQISFNRSDGSIYNESIVSLPEEFTVTSPIKGQIFTDLDTVLVSWSPERNDKGILLTILTYCKILDGTRPVATETRFIPDTGSTTINLNDLALLDQIDILPNQQCNFEVALKRSNLGTVDAAFDKLSSIKASTVREILRMKINLTD